MFTPCAPCSRSLAAVPDLCESCRQNKAVIAQLSAAVNAASDCDGCFPKISRALLDAGAVEVTRT